MQKALLLVLGVFLPEASLATGLVVANAELFSARYTGAYVAILWENRPSTVFANRAIAPNLGHF